LQHTFFTQIPTGLDDFSGVSEQLGGRLESLAERRFA
jgi:hypothetical protein